MKDYRVIKNIDIGGSPIIKTILEKDGKLFILRKYNPKFMDGRLKAFELRNSIDDVNMPRIEEHGKDYAIFEYIAGDVLTDKNNIDDYSIMAANELKKLHKRESSDVNLFQKYNKSLESKLSKINCLNSMQLEIINEYIDKNVEILKNRKASIIHGDFHPGNIVVNENELYLIDLDMLRIDEKYRDLVNIFGTYKNFYNKLYETYFNKSIPEEFYIINHLYSILLTLDYINYSKREFNDINKGLKVFNEYMESTNYLKEKKPKWMI